MSAKIKRVDLQKLLKENQLKGYSHLCKADLIMILTKEGVLKHLSSYKEKERIKPCKNFDCTKIRTCPRQVRLVDKETGKVKCYASIYQCAKDFKVNPGIIYYHNKRSNDFLGKRIEILA